MTCASALVVAFVPGCYSTLLAPEACSSGWQGFQEPALGSVGEAIPGLVFADLSRRS